MKLTILPEVYQQVMYWVQKANFEVSGFGIVKIIDGCPTVTKAILLEQEGSSGETEMDPNAITKAEFELKDEDGEMRWWWHSHVDMNVFWSGTDKDTIKQLGTHGWFFHTVFNKKYERKTAFSCPQTLDFPLWDQKYIYIIEDGQDEIGYPMSKAIVKDLDDQFDANVKRKTYVHSGANYYDDTIWSQIDGRRKRYDELSAEDIKEIESLSDSHYRKQDYNKWKKKEKKVSKKQKRMARMKNGLISDIKDKALLEAEIEDMIMDGYSDQAIKVILEEPIKTLGIDLQQIRTEVMALLARSHGVS